MRGRIDPDWEEANFGEEFNWDQARSIEMKQQQQLKDFDITEEELKIQKEEYHRV
jgi:hypothetical protein